MRLKCFLFRRQPLSPRKACGSQLAEFGPALALLLGIIFLPLVDLTVIPIRWMLAQNLASDYARNLALCETFSQSKSKLDAEPSLSARLKALGGITTKDIDLHLKVSPISASSKSSDFIARLPGEVPAELLPSERNTPCSYMLELQIHSQLAPAIMLPNFGVSIPGLNDSIPMVISAAHEWENLGRDPKTKGFYLNE